MLKILGILCGILLFTLAGMALLIIEECIRDWFRYRKSAVNRGKGSHQRISNDDSCSSRRTNVGTSHHAWVEHATAAMMAQEAHDTACATRSGCTMMPAVWLTRVMTQPCMITRLRSIATSNFQRHLISAVVIHFSN